MAKRFKLRLTRVIPSFQSCRSKAPSTLPSNPVPSFLRRSPCNPNPITLHLPTRRPPTPSSKPHHSSLKRHVSSVFTSIGCGLRSRSSSRYLSETVHNKSRPPLDFHWKKEDKWHVVGKLYDESPRQKINTSSSVSKSNKTQADTVLLPPPPPPNTERRKPRHKKKKTASRLRISTSSADDSVFFSSEGYDINDDINDEKETETLVSSSRSFCSDFSSEFNPHLETIRESPFRMKKLVYKRQKRLAALKKEARKDKIRRRSCNESTSFSPARLSRFQRLIGCTVEGKVRESFAVVKISEDPHEDFKRSMMEMILEKQMFEKKDLEQLLHCFLSLNSSHHHGVIVLAFSEIWEALFSRINLR